MHSSDTIQHGKIVPMQKEIVIVGIQRDLSYWCCKFALHFFWFMSMGMRKDWGICGMCRRTFLITDPKLQKIGFTVVLGYSVFKLKTTLKGVCRDWNRWWSSEWCKKMWNYVFLLPSAYVSYLATSAYSWYFVGQKLAIGITTFGR